MNLLEDRCIKWSNSLGLNNGANTSGVRCRRYTRRERSREVDGLKDGLNDRGCNILDDVSFLGHVCRLSKRPSDGLSN
jgi:hypothetical protein